MAGKRLILARVVSKVKELIYIDPEAGEGAEHTEDRKNSEHQGGLKILRSWSGTEQQRE